MPTMLADPTFVDGVLRGAPVSIDTIVVGLHLRWRGVWQRPNHIVSRLAKRFDVIVVEEPLQAGADRNRVERVDGITLVVPERRIPGDVVDAETIAEVRSRTRGRQPAFWLYSPLMLPLVDAYPGAPLVYDKMDELAMFAGADCRMRERERTVLQQAAVVFAGGRSLWESVRERARAGMPLASGVDVAHFAASRSTRRTPGAAPRFGYVGVLDERIDFALLAQLARARADAEVELVGPVAKIDPAGLPLAPNLHYRGPCSYAELPAILGTFDVALMPFALNDATRYISPTKTLEYLAAGKPVVSTAVPDVVADYSDVVSVAANSAAFAQAVARAEHPDVDRRKRGIERATKQSWDAVVAAMLAECGRLHII